MFKTLVLDIYPLVKNEIVTSQPTHRYNTRNPAYVVPFIRVDKCKQKLSFQGVCNWNAIPTHIKNSTSVFSFKRACKKYLIERYLQHV